MPFRWTINPYRGCSHACVYCFARPTHEYLGFDIGEDFDRRIVVKVNAVERLRAELRAPRWAGEEIAMGTNTDPYQPVEGRYRLTRGVIEVLTEAANPFSILTKSTLIGRDVDLLAEARDAHRGEHRVLDRLSRRGRLAGGRAAHAQPDAPRRDRREARRRGAALRRADGADPAGHLRRPGPDRGGRARVRRGRRHVDHPDPAAPARRACGSTTWRGSRRAAPS